MFVSQTSFFLKPFYTNRKSVSTRSSYDLDYFKGNSRNYEVIQIIPQVFVARRSERIRRPPVRYNDYVLLPP